MCVVEQEEVQMMGETMFRFYFYFHLDVYMVHC